LGPLDPAFGSTSWGPALFRETQRKKLMSGTGWILIDIVGPLLLAAILIWAIVSNRRRSRKERERSEEATRELYQKIDREES
jgi:hypothetical protein